MLVDIHRLGPEEPDPRRDARHPCGQAERRFRQPEERLDITSVRLGEADHLA